MGFDLTPNAISSGITVNINDTTISTKVTSLFFTTSDPVQEFVLSSHTIKASLKIIYLGEPWPKLQVQISKKYAPYQPYQ